MPEEFVERDTGTLALLALQPGKLTVEYLAGRRQRYIIPLRLCLTASFLFFAVAQGNAWSTYRNGDRLAALRATAAPAMKWIQARR
jgi:hypothetical protein